LFSALIVVGDDARLRPLLTDVYGHLDLPFDPASVGSLSTEMPGLIVDTVEQQVLQAYGAGSPQPLDDATLELAAGLAADHRVSA
jgi:hypothetical protein